MINIIITLLLLYVCVYTVYNHVVHICRSTVYILYNCILYARFHRQGLDQGSSNLSLEVQCAAEFSSNPDQTHLPVIF